MYIVYTNSMYEPAYNLQFILWPILLNSFESIGRFLRLTEIEIYDGIIAGCCIVRRFDGGPTYGDSERTTSE